MTVSSRHILSISAAILAFGAGIAMMPSTPSLVSEAEACCAPQKPGPQQPGGQKPAPQQPSFAQPKFPQQVVKVPGVSIGAPQVSIVTPNVIVQPGVIAGPSVIGPTIIGSPVFGGADGGVSFVFGGGGGFAPPSPVPPSVIEGFSAGGTETETVVEDVPETITENVTRSREVVVTKAIRAVCLDDQGRPNPAARLTPDETVDPSFSGELFRCVAGSAMQVTVGRFENGRAVFDQATAFACQKGEALVHGPGGNIACATQTAERNCNERSLLRRFGPGVKVVTMPMTETFSEPTTRTITRKVTRQREVVKTGNLPLDGGVGQGVF